MQETNNVQITNDNKRKFDLEDRTTNFFLITIDLCKKIPNNTINRKIIDQLIRSSGSIGANYREGNDSLGEKDFFHKIKISRKEVKESIHWLRGLERANPDYSNEINKLLDEANELKCIFSAIIKKQK